MPILIFMNLPALVIFGLAFGVAFWVGDLTGITEEGPLMIVAGPLSGVMDLAYRWRRPRSDRWKPSTGGAFCGIPVWVLGILWLVLGVAYSVGLLA